MPVLRLKTSASGQATVFYRSSQIAGMEEIEATPTVGEGCSFARTIDVKVPGLSLLGASSDYVKVGGTPGHLGPPSSTTDNNHWGTGELHALIGRIARNFRAVSTGKLRINDMSLPWGGKFDMLGTWDQNPGKHTTKYGHGMGRAVDVPYRTTGGVRPRDVYQALTNEGLVEAPLSGLGAPSGIAPMKFFNESAEPGPHFHVMR